MPLPPMTCSPKASATGRGWSALGVEMVSFGGISVNLELGEQGSLPNYQYACVGCLCRQLEDLHVF